MEQNAVANEKKRLYFVYISDIAIYLRYNINIYIMNILSFFEVEDMFSSLETNEKAFVRCPQSTIKQLQMTYSDAVVIPVRGSDDKFVLVRGKRSDREEILSACRRCGFGQLQIATSMKISYVRNLVSDYNKEHGTNIRVKDEKNGLVTLSDDLLKRESVSVEEFNKLSEVELDHNDEIV